MDTLDRPLGDVRGEQAIGRGLCDLMACPVDGLIEKMSVADRPIAARIPICNKVRTFDMLVILGVLNVGEKMGINHGAESRKQSQSGSRARQ